MHPSYEIVGDDEERGEGADPKRSELMREAAAIGLLVMLEHHLVHVGRHLVELAHELGAVYRVTAEIIHFRSREIRDFRGELLERIELGELVVLERDIV